MYHKIYLRGLGTCMKTAAIWTNKNTVARKAHASSHQYFDLRRYSRPTVVSIAKNEHTTDVTKSFFSEVVIHGDNRLTFHLDERIKCHVDVGTTLHQAGLREKERKLKERWRNSLIMRSSTAQVYMERMG